VSYPILIFVVFLCLNGNAVQQLLLSRLSLKEYILNAPRISIISANKEGIVSLLGTSHTMKALSCLKTTVRLSLYPALRSLGWYNDTTTNTFILSA
jgi:hypothetical protein